MSMFQDKNGVELNIGDNVKWCGDDCYTEKNTIIGFDNENGMIIIKHEWSFWGKTEDYFPTDSTEIEKIF